MESWWLQLFMANVQCHWEAEALCRVSHKPLRYEEQEGMGMKECQELQLSHTMAGAKETKDLSWCCSELSF